MLKPRKRLDAVKFAALLLMYGFCIWIILSCKIRSSAPGNEIEANSIINSVKITDFDDASNFNEMWLSTFQYDARLKQVMESKYDSSTNGVITAKTIYKYDNSGRLLNIYSTDLSGSYAGADFEYNANGDLKTVFFHDFSDRVVEIDFSVTSQHGRSIIIQYDTLQSNAAVNNSNSRPSIVTYTFNDAGKLVSQYSLSTLNRNQSNPYNDTTMTLFSYDENNHVTKIITHSTQNQFGQIISNSDSLLVSRENSNLTPISDLNRVLFRNLYWLSITDENSFFANSTSIGFNYSNMEEPLINTHEISSASGYVHTAHWMSAHQNSFDAQGLLIKSVIHTSANDILGNSQNAMQVREYTYGSVR